MKCSIYSRTSVNTLTLPLPNLFTMMKYLIFLLPPLLYLFACEQVPDPDPDPEEEVEVLACQHDGVFNKDSARCECVLPYYGTLCEDHLAEALTGQWISTSFDTKYPNLMGYYNDYDHIFTVIPLNHPGTRIQIYPDSGKFYATNLSGNNLTYTGQLDSTDWQLRFDRQVTMSSGDSVLQTPSVQDFWYDEKRDRYYMVIYSTMETITQSDGWNRHDFYEKLD